VLSSLQKLPYGFVAALTGVMAFPLPSSAAEASPGAALTKAADVTETAPEPASAGVAPTAPDPATTAAEPLSSGDDDDAPAPAQIGQENAPQASAQGDTPDSAQGNVPANSCLVKTICSIKQKIRWQSPAWTPTECQRIANAVTAASKRYDLSPTLVLAVMINESDMNEKAFRLSLREGKVYAKDGGLMAIRCVVDRKDRCVNGNVRGMSWKDLMDPVHNIEVGARELAYWRDEGGVTRTIVHRRDQQGHMQEVAKNAPCHHLTHAWWAHYNHGPRYIDKGYPRHYPHRVAVLDHALATVMNVEAPELKQRITIHDPGKRERTVDRPLERRFKKLYNEILSSGTCSALALN
jgi:hypothetical protein